MATDNLKYCKWCKHTMLRGALVCQQCHYGQSTLNKPGLSKILEIASIVLALSAVIFAWQKASDAAASFSQSEKLSAELEVQETSLASLASNTTELHTDATELSSIVADSLRIMYRNTLVELATDKKLLDLLCPPKLTESAMRLDCDIRHVDFSAKAIIALEAFTQLSPAVAKNSNIDKLGALKTICGYRPKNIAALFNAGDYVMGLENYVPFQNMPEIPLENPQNLPSEEERQQSLASDVIAFYKDESKKWAGAGAGAYENLEKLCS